MKWLFVVDSIVGIWIECHQLMVFNFSYESSWCSSCKNAHGSFVWTGMWDIPLGHHWTLASKYPEFVKQTSWDTRVPVFMCSVAQLCLTLRNSMNCSPPGSSVHGILQAGILEWVDMSSFRGSSWPRGWTFVSYVSCIGRWVLYPLSHKCMSVQNKINVLYLNPSSVK